MHAFMHACVNSVPALKKNTAFAADIVSHVCMRAHTLAQNGEHRNSEKK
jgi:hypothetical protein